MVPTPRDELVAFARALERHVMTEGRAEQTDEIARRSVDELLVKTRSLKPRDSLSCDLYALVMVHLTRVIIAREPRATALDECLTLSIEAVMTAFHASSPPQSPPDAPTTARGFGLVDPAVFLSAFRRVLSSSSAVWVDMGVTIAVCSLVLQRQRRTSSAALSMSQIQELLDACLAGGSDESGARSAVLLQALLVAIERQDDDRATALLRQGVSVDAAAAGAMGALRFWYGVLLARAGRRHAARAQLQLAIRDDVAPALALQLCALLALQDDDVDAATDDLQRCLEASGDDCAAMFNVAMLLKRLPRDLETAATRFQLLEFCERQMQRKPESAEEMATSVEVVGASELQRLLPAARDHVDPLALMREMALAAMDAGAWEDARDQFQRLVRETQMTGEDASDIERQLAYVLLQCNQPEDALAACDRVLDRLVKQNSSAHRRHPAELELLFLKADALLCLEQVPACTTLLETQLQPQIDQALEGDNSHWLRKQHTQLINNLAVVLSCQPEGTTRATALLRDGVRRYPDDHRLAFNLALLLWREQQHDAACTVWFAARGWSLRMTHDDLRAMLDAVEESSHAQDVALAVTMLEEAHALTSHVEDADGDGGLLAQQTRFLDALVLDHWARVQRESPQIATLTAKYVEYLESLE
ncbi:hypothetical protein P43SY_009491 [Pythium insidiosum]|uniref:Tetratricopeptide repeat protein n=1 Tax=Pythium insidiosum TaxID=114742 RepID=A0AAD5M367_PYTIN|nr:hypothetical protein P43SY_009491 [Pythium insidiosum]